MDDEVGGGVESDVRFEVLADVLEGGAQPFGILVRGAVKAHSLGPHRYHAQRRQSAAVGLDRSKVQQPQFVSIGLEALDAFVVADGIPAAVQDELAVVYLDRSWVV